MTVAPISDGAHAIPEEVTRSMGTPVDDLTFEQAFAELEEVVRALEAGNQSLDEALALYERGMQLAARCQKLLDAAEVRIRQLVPNDEGGYDLEEFTGSLDRRD